MRRNATKEAESMMCIGTTMRMGDRMNWKLGNEQAMLLLNWKCGASPKKLQIFVVHRDNTDRERFRQWQQAREAKNPNSEINKHDHSFLPFHSYLRVCVSIQSRQFSRRECLIGGVMRYASTEFGISTRVLRRIIAAPALLVLKIPQDRIRG